MGESALKVCFRPVILFHGSLKRPLDKHHFFFIVSSFLSLGDLSKVIRVASTLKHVKMLTNAKKSAATAGFIGIPKEEAKIKFNRPKWDRRSSEVFELKQVIALTKPLFGLPKKRKRSVNF